MMGIGACSAEEVMSVHLAGEANGEPRPVVVAAAHSGLVERELAPPPLLLEGSCLSETSSGEHFAGLKVCLV